MHQCGLDPLDIQGSNGRKGNRGEWRFSIPVVLSGPVEQWCGGEWGAVMLGHGLCQGSVKHLRRGGEGRLLVGIHERHAGAEGCHGALPTTDGGW
jgi:hypothetical protein